MQFLLLGIFKSNILVNFRLYEAQRSEFCKLHAGWEVSLVSSLAEVSKKLALAS